MKPCDVKQHFTCDGSGKECIVCGESEGACSCDEDEQDLINCRDCDGTGRICVEHDSPCGDLKKPPQCDAAKAGDMASFRPFDKKPCSACPFRRTAARGWLGDAPPEMFIGNINAELPSPCHSSIDYSDPAWTHKWKAGKIGKLCTGALIMASNMCKLARKQDIIPAVPQDIETVFARPQEFIDYHRASSYQSWNEEPTNDSYYPETE